MGFDPCQDPTTTQKHRLSPTSKALNMPKKRVQSSATDSAEATVIAAASSSTEPVKEPRLPLQLSYCGSQSMIPSFFNLISEILIDALFHFKSVLFPLNIANSGLVLRDAKNG